MGLSSVLGSSPRRARGGAWAAVLLAAGGAIGCAHQQDGLSTRVQTVADTRPIVRDNENITDTVAVDATADGVQVEDKSRNKKNNSNEPANVAIPASTSTSANPVPATANVPAGTP